MPKEMVQQVRSTIRMRVQAKGTWTQQLVQEIASQFGVSEIIVYAMVVAAAQEVS